MKEIVTTNYFWGQDVEMSQFYRVPKALYTGEYFRGISFEAKAIYGMMIDRVSLSIKNGWLDEDGKTYIHYSVADIMADTGCGTNKILKCLKELVKARFLKLNMSHIEYVMKCLRKNTTKVYNIKKNYETEKCNLTQKSVPKWQNNLSKTQICVILGLKNATSCKNLP